MAALVFNTRNFQSNMRRIQGQVGRQIHRAVMDGGNKLVTMTYKDVPLDTGALRTSGRVTIIGGGIDISQGTVSFSENAPHNGFNYAALQHENVFHHPKGGKDHYLSDYVDKEYNFIIETMNRTLRQVL